MEIYQVPPQKNFVGNAEFKMVVLASTKIKGFVDYSANLGSFYSPKMSKDGRVLMDHQFDAPDDIRMFLRDPGMQSKILEAAGNAMRGQWSNKVLDKTWHETKDIFFSSYKEKIDKFLDSLRFDLYVCYKVKLKVDVTEDPAPGSSFGYETYPSFIRTEPEFVKSYLAHELVDEPTLVEIKAEFARGIEVMVEKEMQPFMEDEITRRENDIQMLKILTKRYPNFPELIKEKQTA